MNEKNTSKSQIVKNLCSSIVNLQKKSPKVFYGGITLLFIVFLFVFVGSGTQEAPQMQVSLAKNQSYNVKSPNGGPILLLARPGFGSRESGEENNVCTIETGTQVTFIEETMLNFITFVKVSPESGPCHGKKGWMSKVNIST